MQQFLLFFIMLIIASEAFSKELHGSRVTKRFNRRRSRFSQELTSPNPELYMFRRLFPMFSEPRVYENPDYQDYHGFLLPMGHYPVRPKLRKKNRECKRFINRKRSRRKNLKASPSNVAFRGVENFWPSGLLPDFRIPRNVSDFFVRCAGDEFLRKNPNQYILCFYPLFIRPKKRATDMLKNHRYYNLRRQCLINVKNKNKRSANNFMKGVPLRGHKLKTTLEENKNEKLPATSLRSVVFGSYHRKRATPDGKNLDYTRVLQRPTSDFKYDDTGKNLDYFNTNLYNPYVGLAHAPVTLPTVTFKYPYDPEVYDTCLRNEKKSTKQQRKQTVGEDTLKRNAPINPSSEVSKLSQMLNEVESFLKWRQGDKDGTSDEEGTSGLEKQQDNRTTAEGEKKNNNSTLTDKIDSVIPILLQISEDLKKIINASRTASDAAANGTANDTKSKARSTSRCSADGTWTSSALGVELTFATMPNMVLNVKVASNDSSLINKKWSVQGLTLSRRGGPIMLAAIYPQRRKIASFIGQCKLCQDEELIFGSWTIFGCVRKFTDLWSAMETKLDVLRKKPDTVNAKRSKNKKNRKSNSD